MSGDMTFGWLMVMGSSGFKTEQSDVTVVGRLQSLLTHDVKFKNHIISHFTPHRPRANILWTAYMQRDNGKLLGSRLRLR